MMSGYTNNLVVTSGEAIPVPDSATHWNYVHMRMSFENIDLIDNVNGPEESSNDAMQKALYGRNAAIYIERIGADLSCGVNTSSIGVVTGAVEAAQYAKMACGIKTKNGSIIPHPIIPDEHFDYADNGLAWGSETLNMPVSGGYVWEPVNLNSAFGGDGLVDSGAREYADTLACYGRRDDDMYVFNVGAEHAVIDREVIAVRGYTCDVSAASAGAGACALVYRIQNASYVTPETTDLAGNKGLTQPYVEFSIGARERADAAVVEDLDMETLVENNTKSIRLTVQAHGGAAAVQVGFEGKEASFTVSENDLYPPQCVPNEDGRIPLSVVYLYPTYYGLVATNSVTKASGSGGGSEVVVGDSLKGVRSPWNNVTIMLEDTASANYLEYAREYLKRNPGSDLEFLPSTLHETKTLSKVYLKVNDGACIRFGNKVSALWSRCTGFWAYCPLYFHRNLTFTLYFKGAYVKPGTTPSFSYYVYPLVLVDSGSDSSQWTGMTDKGAKCLTASLVCSDNDKMESIYKVVFSYQSSEMLRFPIEVLGAEIVQVRKEFQFTHKSGNGKFRLCETSEGTEGSFGLIREKYSKARQLQGTENIHLGLITSVSTTLSLDGVNGSMELDGYPIQQGIGVLRQTQSVGELDLAVDLKDDEGNQHANNPCPTIFRGYGLEIATAGSESDYRMSVKLEGVQRKMNDMNLVCAPFWDGDRLESICLYFEQYMQLQIYMIDNTVKKYSDRKRTGQDMFVTDGTWVSTGAYTKTSADVDGTLDNSFRVPRSFNWMSPAVNFKTGTKCFEALRHLAELTSCVFVVAADGTGVFYELNEYGFPYYVQNQIDNGAYVEFSLQDIVSVNMAPSFENWYNSVATFGFLRKFTPDAAIEQQSDDSVTPGVNYTITGSKLFPWSRHNVGTEQGFLTKEQLQAIHRTRVKFVKSDRSQGTITVLGNTRVTHVYQVIKIAGVYYYVMQISHNIDAARKSWTTSYQIGYFSVGSADGDTDYTGLTP